MAENVDYLSALLQDTTIDSPGKQTPAQTLEKIKQRLITLGAKPGTGEYENAFMSYLGIKANQESGTSLGGFDVSTAMTDAQDYLRGEANSAQITALGVTPQSWSIGTDNPMVAVNASMGSSASSRTTSATSAKAESERRSIIAIMTDRFNKYNLGSLANKIKELAVDGATEATITFGLQETPEYKQRFRANDVRAKNGLAVLSPAEYLNVEDGYRQVLRAYGLRQFDNDDYVQQFIANDMSPTEFSNRIVTAVQRVQNADPAIIQQLRQFYGIGQNDLVAYVLDPQQQFQKIERQVAAAEIGVAAARQGLTAGVSVAEQLAAQGISQAEAQKGYATIADVLPTAEKLSGIYGSTMETYGQAEAEQERFNSLASAQRKRQNLQAREIAAFSGSSGVSNASLTSQTGGQF